ncbi:hypothetical protein BDZ89DRAFT_1019519 [Hymenopellis radicata]|nr:hypothetical protein BDZ89DRAFT_1019519 [Hymenopellis radicata]
MLEPVFNSLFNVHNIPHSSTFNAAARSMTRATHKSVSRDFFCPQPRRVREKGKGRATDFQEEHECSSNHPSLCREWSCLTRHSPWCSKRYHFLMINEFRDSSPRKPPLKRMSSGLHRYSSRRMSLRLTGQRRHASGISDLGTSSSVDTTPSYPKPEEKDPDLTCLPLLPIPPDPRILSVQSLTDALSMPTQKSDSWNLWKAYSLVAEEDALYLTRIDMFLSLAERMLHSTEQLYRTASKDELHTWGDRIYRLLEYTSSRITPSSPFGYRHGCLLARSCCLRGQLDEARMLLHEAQRAQKRWPSLSVSEVYHVYEQMLLSTRIHGPPRELLSLIAEEWGAMGEVLTHIHIPAALSLTDGLWKSRIVDNHPLHLQRLKKAVYSALLSTDHTVSAWKELGKDVQQHIGDLLIRVFCSRPDRWIPVYELFKLMCERDCLPDRIVHLVLVRYLVKQKLMRLAKHAFSLVEAEPLDKPYLSTALYICGQDGDHARAEDIFQKLEEQNMVTREDRSHLLSAYSANGLVQETLDVWNRLFPEDEPSDLPPATPKTRPDAYSYITVLGAFAKRGDIAGLNRWLSRMSNAGIHSSTYTFNLTFEAFANNADIKSIGIGLQQMYKVGVPRDVVTYTIIISALAKKRDPITAEKVFKQALDEGIKPDRVMINALMSAHCEAGSWKGAIKAFDYLAAKKILPAVDTYNILLECYVSIGAPLKVIMALFAKLETLLIEPDQYTYSLAILAACDNGQMGLARRLFSRMDALADTWANHIRVTVYTMTILMSGYLRLGHHGRAKRVYDDLLARGINPNSVTFMEIIRSYSFDKRGNGLELAEEFIKEITAMESRTWTIPPQGATSSMDLIYSPLMWAYSRRKQPEDVERLFKNMVDSGSEPTLGTTTALLDAYRRSGNYDAAETLWPFIFELGLKASEATPLTMGDDDDGSAPRRIQSDILCVPLSIYIDVLSRSEKFDALATVWKSFQDEGLTFNSHNYNHLAVAFTRGGEVERAFEILETVVLPYQRKYASFRRSRDRSPSTPLLFDDEAMLEETIRQPEDSLRGRRSRRNLLAVNARRVKPMPDFYEYETEEEREDMALPLHLLHQISPGWSVWAPHQVTLTIFLLIIIRLREGLLTEALNVHKITVQDDMRSREDIINERAQAMGLYEAIRQQYPNTLNLVMQFESKEHARLGYAGFRRKYMEFVSR